MKEALYHARILDHAKNPRNKGVLAGVCEVRASNPSCGDTLALYITTDGTTITSATFTGEGCALSQSGASMFTEVLRGKTLAEVRSMTEADLLALLGVEVSYARKKCALLVWRAWEEWMHVREMGGARCEISDIGY